MGPESAIVAPARAAESVTIVTNTDPCLGAWYVPRALGERPKSLVPRACRGALIAGLAGMSLALASCGGGERQDENEPEGDFPVEVTMSKFPTDQRLAQTSDLELAIKNTGDEALPELAVTVTTDEGLSDDSFSVRSDQPGLADPNRPVWILENKYPQIVGEPAPKGLSGAIRAQTNTFGFGPLEPGDTTKALWRVTPVQAGTYTLHYIVAAGLDGKAKAVTASGGEVKGEFVVTISDKPPKATVDDAGNVVEG